MLQGVIEERFALYRMRRVQPTTIRMPRCPHARHAPYHEQPRLECNHLAELQLCAHAEHASSHELHSSACRCGSIEASMCLTLPSSPTDLAQRVVQPPRPPAIRGYTMAVEAPGAAVRSRTCRQIHMAARKWVREESRNTDAVDARQKTRGHCGGAI